MVHTAVVLPSDLLDRLKQDAEASGKGLSTLIRQRLQLSYVGSPDDAETHSLLQAINQLADALERDLGCRWDGDQYALLAFKAGINSFLDRYVLSGNPNRRPDAIARDREGDLPDDPPEVVGRVHARIIEISD